MNERWLGMVAAAWLGGCAGPQMPVPVSGTATDLAVLAGEWSGEYSSSESGRSGSIVFRLKAGTDSATGDVLMRVPFWTHRDVQNERPVLPGPATEPQVLAISFVMIQGGRISGRLAPYADPACGCTLNTVFEGVLKGDDTLEGTFTSRHSATGEVQQGRWLVTRKPR